MKDHTFKYCTVADAERINAIAHKSWWSTYATFLPEEQIDFMLNELYNPAVLRKQIEEGIGFLIIELESQPVGFVSFTRKADSTKIFRIEKLYLLKEAQGCGLGKALVDEVAELAKQDGFEFLELNVNRSNPAYHFYIKQGFTVVKEVDIPYYHFTLNDYILQKEV